MTTDDVRKLTAFQLANEAGTPCPDAPDSAGSMFLMYVRDSICEGVDDALADAADDERTDAIMAWAEDGTHEVADGAPNVYTHQKWLEFADLGAYQEDLDDLGGSAGDMDRDASVALYIIAERLAQRLVEFLTDDDDGS